MVNQLLLLLLLLAPVGVFADYFNLGGATDSSYGMVPYSSQCQLDSTITCTYAFWVKNFLSAGTTFGTLDTTAAYASSLGGYVQCLSPLRFFLYGGTAKYRWHFPKNFAGLGSAQNSHFVVMAHVGGLNDSVTFYYDGIAYKDSIVKSGNGFSSINLEQLTVGGMRGTKKTTTQAYFSGNLFGLTIDSGAVWTQAQVKKYYNGGLYNPMLYNGTVRHHWPLIYSTAGQAVKTFQDIGYGPKLHGAIYTVKDVAVPTLGGNVIGAPTPMFIPGQE